MANDDTMSNADQYDYALPRDLIAQFPLPNRADARLMVVKRYDGSISHHHIRDLPELLSPDDLLVLNDTRVVAARLVGYRTKTRGRWEGLFLSIDPQGQWRLLCKVKGRLAPPESITLVDRDGRDDVRLWLLEKHEGGVWAARLEEAADPMALLTRVGRVPLPFYIRGGEMVDADLNRYQTVYARVLGSVAAPTAGLHFTPELLGALARRGIDHCFVTLHVGLDTFRPIVTPSLEEHAMHSEWGCVDAPAAEMIRKARLASRGRVVAVGTTTVRLLETAADSQGCVPPWTGQTRLFVRPPYCFRAVDALLTNFHLPRSTLLVLVRTFGGDALIRKAYKEAVRERYRFYSYGDAMLIL